MPDATTVTPLVDDEAMADLREEIVRIIQTKAGDGGWHRPNAEAAADAILRVERLAAALRPVEADDAGLIEALNRKIGSVGAWMTSDLREFYTKLRDRLASLSAAKVEADMDEGHGDCVCDHCLEQMRVKWERAALRPVEADDAGLIEGVARAIASARSWQTGALTVGDWDDRNDAERLSFTELARAAIAAMPSVDTTRTFALGDRVTKIKGSSWSGKVVGFYSTDLTPEGYAVESENEPGSVQIYPRAALKEQSR